MILWRDYTISTFFVSVCSCVCSFEARSNKSLKLSTSLNISGKIKLSKAHNSVKLFWSGVPVSNSLYHVRRVHKSIDNLLSLFFSQWASSTIKYYQIVFFKWVKQIQAPSYVVIQTSNFPGSMNSFKIGSHWSAVGIKLTTLQHGSHFANSLTQLPTQDFGTITRNFPSICLYSLRKAIKEIHSIVFPNPIGYLC